MKWVTPGVDLDVVRVVADRVAVGGRPGGAAVGRALSRGAPAAGRRSSAQVAERVAGGGGGGLLVAGAGSGGGVGAGRGRRRRSAAGLRVGDDGSGVVADRPGRPPLRSAVAAARRRARRVCRATRRAVAATRVAARLVRLPLVGGQPAVASPGSGGAVGGRGVGLVDDGLGQRLAARGQQDDRAERRDQRRPPAAAAEAIRPRSHRSRHRAWCRVPRAAAGRGRRGSARRGPRSRGTWRGPCGRRAAAARAGRRRGRGGAARGP